MVNQNEIRPRKKKLEVDAKLRRITGHRIKQMTEHYTRFRIEDFADVRLQQDQMFSDTS